MLVEIHAAHLRTVVDEPIAATNHDRAGAQDTVRRGILVVQPTAHGGYFDLVIRTTVSASTFGEEDEGSNAAKNQRTPMRSEMRRLVWSGERYTVVDGG